jgi:L-methionine (R)-S-oxide reductase
MDSTDFPARNETTHEATMLHPSLRSARLFSPRAFDDQERTMKGVGKFGEVMATEKGKVSYDDVAARLDKIIHSGSQRKAITDFVCRELRKIPHYTWVGIYLVDGADLVLASWSGPAATLHNRIPIGKGICGAAVSEKATIIVPDVNNDPRYLQCFINTRAEIVVPILRGGAPIAELDIDSDQLNAFTATDKEFLEWVAEELVKIL